MATTNGGGGGLSPTSCSQQLERRSIEDLLAGEDLSFMDDSSSDSSRDVGEDVFDGASTNQRDSYDEADAADAAWRYQQIQQRQRFDEIVGHRVKPDSSTTIDQPSAAVNGGLGTSSSNNLSPVIQRKGINPNWSSIAPTPDIEVGEVDDDDNIDDDRPRNEASVETDRLRLPLRDAEGAEGSCQEDGGLRSPPDGGSDTESLPESIYHQPPKAADREAAARLARRLYLLEGFKFTDVAKHLSRKNDFNTIVGEEYANNFDFTGDTLDAALRKFLSRFCLLGDTADQERVLLHFAKSYLRCNPASYPSADSCHTLACALLLLNKDLHGMTGQRMTSQQFIDNLANLNEGDNYPREVLKSLYQAIRAQPILQPASGPIVPQHLLMQQPAGNGGG
uniref:SEC7 domain-containing protein n=1 Tax=Macrostomum lignano TaxID=282301 RepID=A0A1I8HUK0_9PLAT